METEGNLELGITWILLTAQDRTQREKENLQTTNTQLRASDEQEFQDGLEGHSHLQGSEGQMDKD